MLTYLHMKKIYIYGAHVKLGYDIEVEDFSDISGKVKSKAQDISKLIVGHKWRHRPDLPADECNARECRLLQWSEHVSGTASKRGIYCRVALMNDEVLWQWRTGSVLTYRFESMKDSLAYYRTLFPDCNISIASRTGEYEVGDVVKLLADVTSPFGYTYHAGEELRVYDVQNGKIVPTGVDGKTYLRVPGTGGSKIHIGYCLIDKNDVISVKRM